MHRKACGARGCACRSPVPSVDDWEPLPDAPDLWQETAIMAITDLVLEEQEGTVTITTTDGRTCHVRVSFVPGVGYLVNTTGGQA
jgi:hypothetical protein